MFKEKDQDRFGDQIFPLVPIYNPPGPGQYENNLSLESKANMLLIR